MDQNPVKKPTPSHPNSLLVYIGTPEKNLFEGEARTVSSVNDIGPFDVLPMHENFISTIKKKVIVTPFEGEKKTFEIGNGILRAHNNNVEVFLGVDLLNDTSDMVSKAIGGEQTNPLDK